MHTNKRTPWAHVLDSVANKDSPIDSDAPGVRLREIDTGIVILRASADAKNLDTALQASVGISLPERLSFSSSDEYSIYWMSPDEWLLTYPHAKEQKLESELAEVQDSHHVAVINTSSAICQLQLRGEHAIDVLKKSTAYDVHHRNFPIGKVVNTTFAKTQATIAATGEGRYQLFVRRSYSDYLWLWLQRAAKGYGLDVEAA